MKIQEPSKTTKPEPIKQSAGREHKASTTTPQEFYRKVTERQDLAELLKRLAER